MCSHGEVIVKSDIGRGEMVSILNCSLFDEIFETEENSGHSSCFQSKGLREDLGFIHASICGKGSM